MRTRTALGAMLSAAAALTLAACDREATAHADRNAARVGQKIDSALERTQRKLAEAGEKTQQGLAAAGARIQPSLDEAAITASIKTDFLKDPDLSVLKIDVDTRGGVVTLNGLADNEAARARAAQIAGAIKGVTEVRNHLTVKRA